MDSRKLNQEVQEAFKKKMKNSLIHPNFFFKFVKTITLEYQ